MLIQGHGNIQQRNLELGILECKAYHNVLLNTKSQIDFDWVHQLQC
jgi:hypothetical protein